METDNDIDDEGYVQSLTTSYVTSIASDIRKGVLERGRRYPSYGKHMYGLPIDEDEQDRNDLQHCKFILIYGGKLHLAPIPDEPSKILDLGTGSGIWAIDIADRFPSAQVTGVDIAAVQPTWVPPNCVFEILDVESEWHLRKNSYDFIHAREFLFAIRDWPALIAQAYDHVKPGGYLELSATVPIVGCDDDSLPSDSLYKEVSSIFFESGAALGTDGNAPKQWKTQLEAQGFEGVVENIFKIPTNPWPKDKRLKEIGALEVVNVSEFITGAYERGYVGLLGKNPDDLQVLLARTRREVTNRAIHSYVYFYNVYGRKPEMPTGGGTGESGVESNA